MKFCVARTFLVELHLDVVLEVILVVVLKKKNGLNNESSGTKRVGPKGGGGGVRYGYRNQIDGYLLDRETERTEELKDSQVI